MLRHRGITNNARFGSECHGHGSPEMPEGYSRYAGCCWTRPAERLPGEVGGLTAEDIRRKCLTRHPRYVPLETPVDAGRQRSKTMMWGLR